MSDIQVTDVYGSRKISNNDTALPSKKSKFKIPSIKNKFVFFISIGILLIAIYFVIDRIQFVSVAKHTSWEVELVNAKNDVCSERRNKRTHYYDCTKFTATIEFDTLPPPPIIHSRFTLSAGSVRWHNQPLSRATRYQGQPTKVTYDPDKIDRVYEDSLYWVWWEPIMAFFAHIMTLISSFTEKRKHYN